VTRRALLFCPALPALASQLPPPGFPSPTERPKRLPDGRLQSEAIIKEDYERNMRDLEEMERLLTRIHAELEKATPGKAGREVFRDLESVERLGKRIRGRMRRF
jgi:hypothetical protein